MAKKTLILILFLFSFSASAFESKNDKTENRTIKPGELEATITNLENTLNMAPSNGFIYPKIDPVALKIGVVEIKWYSLAYLFGILFGWYLAKFYNRKYSSHPIPELVIDSTPLWMILSIIIGGRLGYVIFYNLDYYMNNITEIPMVWKGGMSFHGGLLGVIIGLFIFSRVHKLPYLKTTDIIACVAPIGLFLGRIANFINDELRGKIADATLPWGVYYPYEIAPHHPSQIYEALTEGLLLFVILLVGVKYFKALDKVGLSSGLFLIFYSTFRAFCEFYRFPDYQLGYLHDKWLTMGMVLCLPTLFLGLLVLIVTCNKPRTVNNQKQ